MSYSAVNAASDSNDWPGQIYPQANSGLDVMGVNDHILIGFKAYVTR